MSLENEVKTEILVIAGIPEEAERLSDATILQRMGFDELMCRDLEERCQEIADAASTGRRIRIGSITPANTVGHCIGLVKDLTQ